MTRLSRFLLPVLLLMGWPAAAQDKPAIVISSLAELAQAAARDGQVVTMKPGVYRLTDLIPMSTIAERRKRKEWPFFVFGGSGNVFQCKGVVIEVDTALRAALHPPVHTNEFVIAGGNNVLGGLTIRHVGNGTSPGGAALAVTGVGNTLRDCTLNVRGSFPYGYGDVFGKGGAGIIAHQKKSGVLVTGHNTTLLGCRLFMRAFGHGYFVQQDAANVRFENCMVEGDLRRTEEMLAETSGPAFDVHFRTTMKNREGEFTLLPGYVKSLCEDGFRTYGNHPNLVLKNCTAKNMRGGFELRTKTAPKLENCTAVGCERGFWVSSGASMTKCKGDAQHGPLLYVEGDNARIDLELLPLEDSKATVHAIAAIQGSGHRITLRPAPYGRRAHALPILAGYGPPGMGENMAPYSEKSVSGLILRNDTPMPVVIGAQASTCEITTLGPVTENQGKKNVVLSLAKPGETKKGR